MPAGFQYAATNFINSGSAARTTPEDDAGWRREPAMGCLVALLADIRRTVRRHTRL